MFKTEQEKCDHFNSRFIVGSLHDRDRLKQKSPAFLDDDGQAIALFEEDWDDDHDGNIFVSLLLNIDPQYKIACPTRVDYLEELLAKIVDLNWYGTGPKKVVVVDALFLKLIEEAKILLKGKPNVDA